MRGLELIIRGDNRSAIRALKEVADQSNKTGSQVARDSEKADASFKRMGRSATLLRDSVSGLAGMVGLGGLAFGLKDVVTGGIQLQSAQAQLQQALKATGQAAGGTYERLARAAESLSVRGGFATPQNLQALTAYTRETRNAGQSIQMLNLATNIARGRNMDLATAQTVVARAYTGSVGRLQQLLGPMVASKDAAYGLTQAHKEQIAQLQLESQAMGRNGAAWLHQQEIVDGITPKMRALATLTDKRATAQQVMAAAAVVFGGATGAYASTTQGKISDLQNQLKNLVDTIGVKLLPTVNVLAKDLTWVVGAFSRLPTPLQAVIIGATGLGLIMSPLVRSFNAFKDIFTLFSGEVQATTPQVARLGVASDAAAAGETAAAGGGLAAGGEGALLAGGAAGAAGGLTRAAAMRGLLAAGAGALAASSIRSMTGLGNRHGHSSGVGSLAGTIAGGGLGFLLGGPLGAGIGAGVGNLAGGFLGTLFSSGGIVRPRHLAMGGGPFGTDTVPAWLTPGEGVVSTRGMEALSMLNMGIAPGGDGNVIVQQPIVVKLDGKVLTQAVVRQVLNRAARGPSNAVGGSLVTGAPGIA